MVFKYFEPVKLTKTQEKKHEEFRIELGKRIVLLRKKRKFSQSDLAYKIGWDKPNLRKIEHGHGNPTLKSLLLIAEGLDISLIELIDI